MHADEDNLLTAGMPLILHANAVFVSLAAGATSCSEGQVDLRKLVLTLIVKERELSPPSAPAWANRKILPEFSRLQVAGAFQPLVL